MIRLRIFGILGLWRIRRGLGLAAGPDIARVRLGRRGLRVSSGIGPFTATSARRRPRQAGGRVSVPGVVFATVVAVSFVVCTLAGVR